MSNKQGKHIIKQRVKDFFDHFKFSVVALPALFRDRKFYLPFALTFIFFGILLNMLASGLASLQIFLYSNPGEKTKIVFDAFLAIFGFHRNFLDFILLFSINFLQAILVALVFYVLNFRRKNLAGSIQNTGIIAGFFILASGCPTCGTAILAPIILSILGSSGLALVGTITSSITIFSFLLALYTFQKIGYESYIILEDQKYRAKQEGKAKAKHTKPLKME